MSSKIINFVAVCLFSLCIASNANAGLIIGSVYEDAAGNEWAYVGSFELADGPKVKDANNNIQDVTLYDGLEVAEMLFGSLLEGTYAVSTFLDTDIMGNVNGYGVNHEAWYDIFEGGSTGVSSLSESLSPKNVGGDVTKYDSAGDLTAYVDDRASTKAEILQYIADIESQSLPTPVKELLIADAVNSIRENHVFKSVSTPVPEPSTLAIFSLALIGFASRRFKKQ